MGTAHARRIKARSASRGTSPGPCPPWQRPHAGPCACARCESARAICRRAKAIGLPRNDPRAQEAT